MFASFWPNSFCFCDRHNAEHELRGRQIWEVGRKTQSLHIWHPPMESLWFRTGLMPYMEVPWKPCKFVPRFVNLDERVFLRGELRLQACSASGYAASNCYANVWVWAKWQRWILYTSTNVWCQQMLGIPCTLVVGTHIWCSQPQLLARLMLRCFNSVLWCAHFPNCSADSSTFDGDLGNLQERARWTVPWLKKNWGQWHDWEMMQV